MSDGRILHIKIVTDVIERGYSNGLQKNEMKFLDKGEISYLESHVKCLSGQLKDGSVDYEVISKMLMGTFFR